LKKLFLGLAAFFALAASIEAQQAADQRPIEIGGVTFSGNIRERYEAWNFFDPGAGQNFYGYSGTQIRFGFSQTRKTIDWNIEFEAPILLGVPDQAVRPAPQGQLGLGGSYYVANDKSQNAALIFPKQAFIRFKGVHNSLRLGRFEFTDGSEVKPKDATLAALKADRIGQRLIGTFGFSDVMRSFDGGQYVYSNGPWNLTAVAAVPTRGVFQVDGWGWVKTPITYVALTKQLDLGATQAEVRVFGLYYNDDRPLVKTDNRPGPAKATDFGNINIGTIGAHFISATATEAGTFDLLGWGAAQAGSWGVQTQRSWAGAFEFGYQPKWAPRIAPWFRTGYFYSSGDSDPNDGKHSTFFAVLTTPRVYARFPFFNTMNNRDFFGEVILRPTKAITIRSDAHGLWLSSGNDLWYSGGGAFQPWTFGFQGRPANAATALANLYDISGDFKLRHGLSLGLYFGWAQGRQVIKSLFPENSNGALGYTEVNYHF